MKHPIVDYKDIFGRAILHIIYYVFLECLIPFLKCLIIFLKCLVLCAGFMLLLSLEPVWPDMLEILLSINQSRSNNKVHIMTEYFVDNEKYFIVILLHMNVSTGIGILALLAIASIMIMVLYMACALFKIAR